MNWLEMMKNKQKELKALLATAKAENRALTDDEQKLFDDGQGVIANCQTQLANQDAVNDLDKQLNTVVDDAGKPVISNADKKPVYTNFGAFLTDVKAAAKNGTVPARLSEYQNSLGMETGIGSDGGYLVQTEFVEPILQSVVENSEIIKRCDSYDLPAGKNSIAWASFDEKDISDDSVAGGALAYWAAEAQAVLKSSPTIKGQELKLEKLMALGYTTIEFDDDATASDEMMTRSFSLAIDRKLTAGIVGGDGVGKATGILKGKGLVSVAKEGGQTAATITRKNINSMYHSAINPANGTHVWLMHPDAHEAIEDLYMEIGDGGVPVYRPETLTRPVPLLRGITIVPTDHCSPLGTKGDIILADMQDYLLIFRDRIRKDVSMHIEFLTAQNAYRFILRTNGRPKTTNDLKIKNSSKKRGKYITLDTRA
jgi:HK97 family phage major capsid protein